MRARWMLAVALVGCGTKDGASDDTDAGIETDETDVVVETDDTDVVETDTVDSDTDVADETDETDLPDLHFFFTGGDGHDGAFGGVSGADVVCQYDDGRPTDGTYKALLAGGGRVACTNAGCAAGTDGRADWVLQPNRTYVGDGTRFTTDALALIQFPTPSPLGGAINVWTGLNTDWTTDELTCGDWAQHDPGVNGRVGWADDTDADVLDGGRYNCGVKTFLLCVEQ